MKRIGQYLGVILRLMEEKADSQVEITGISSFRAYRRLRARIA